MNKYQLGRLYPIELTEYNNEWPVLFEKEKKNLEAIFNLPLRIEHIGSTAVPGLMAKPTIDILIEKPDQPQSNDKMIINKMTKNGYIHMTEQSRHLMFIKGYSPSGLEKESFHIHMGPLHLDWLWDRIYFRDYLKNNPEEALVYQELKRALSGKFKNDREAYTDGKAGYIKTVTEKGKKEFR